MPLGIALDQSNLAWIANSSDGHVVVLKSSGVPAAFSRIDFSTGVITIDGAGNAWGSTNSSAIGEIEGAHGGAPGTVLAASYAEGLIAGPFAIGVDPSGNVWVLSKTLIKLIGIAAPVQTPVIGAP